jgi:hypothetical protein
MAAPCDAWGLHVGQQFNAGRSASELNEHLARVRRLGKDRVGARDVISAWPEVSTLLIGMPEFGSIFGTEPAMLVYQAQEIRSCDPHAAVTSTARTCFLKPPSPLTATT